MAFPHGFCDFAYGCAQNDRVEGMLRKMKIRQTGIGTRKICNQFKR
jgi:hypothetical protein